MKPEVTKDKKYLFMEKNDKIDFFNSYVKYLSYVAEIFK